MANTRDVMGDQACLDALIGGTISELEDDGVYEFGPVFRNIAVRSITLPNLESIEDLSSPFLDNDMIESIDLESCAYVGEYAFRDAGSLKTVRIGTTCFIKHPFSNNSSFTSLILDTDGVCSIYNNQSNPSATVMLGVRFEPGGQATVYVPASLLPEYQSHELWSLVNLAAIEE